MKPEQAKARVLDFLRERPMESFYGLEIANGADVSTGRLYPALAGLERDGVVLSEWEATDAPRRRCYWVTIGDAS